MFKSNPKIKSITSCSAGDFLFVFGLGKDGQCYIWNSVQCAWLPHKNVEPLPQDLPEGLPTQPNRAVHRKTNRKK